MDGFVGKVCVCKRKKDGAIQGEGEGNESEKVDLQREKGRKVSSFKAGGL